MRLPEVQRAIRKKFDAVVSSHHTFDYYGMERGGHHAVAKWVLELGGSPYMYITRACSKTPGCEWYHPSRWHSMIDLPNLTALTYGPDVDITVAPTRINHRKVVVCVRDIRNLLASRIKWHDKYERFPFRVDSACILLWQHYAHQALGDIDHFAGRCVSIIFDRWFSDRAYRGKLVQDINTVFAWGMPTLIDNIGPVSRAGGGSSFDGVAPDATTMHVTERWREYEDHPLMQKLLTPDILALNARLLETP
jgi:hypothetical protein